MDHPTSCKPVTWTTQATLARLLLPKIRIGLRQILSARCQVLTQKETMQIANRAATLAALLSTASIPGTEEVAQTA